MFLVDMFLCFLQGTIQGQTQYANWQNLHIIISRIKLKDLLALFDFVLTVILVNLCCINVILTT